jgi:hypothetical protein
MSAKVDQFCDWLRDRLHKIEGWLESVKEHIQALPEKVREDLRNKLEHARTRLHTQRKRVEQTRADLKAQPEAAVDLLVESVIGWKPTPEVRAPYPGEHPAVAHAAATIEHAAAGIDQVEDAMLYAATARLPDAAR